MRLSRAGLTLAGLACLALAPLTPVQAQEDWREHFEGIEVPEGDEKLNEMLRLASEGVDDDIALDRAFELLAYVESKYLIGGEFHLRVLQDARDVANVADRFGKYDIAITRSLEATFPTIQWFFGPEDKRVLRMREDLAWMYQAQGRIDAAKALVGPDHRMFKREPIDENTPIDDYGYAPAPELQTLIREAKTLSGDALIANLSKQSTLRSASRGQEFSAAHVEIDIASELDRLGRRDAAIARLESVIDNRDVAIMDLRVLVGQALAWYLEQAGRTDEALAWLDTVESEYGDIMPNDLWGANGGLDIIEPAYRIPQMNAQRARLYLEKGRKAQTALASARYAAEYLQLLQSTPTFGRETEDRIAASRQAPEGEPFGQDARRIFSHLVEAAWRVARTEREEDAGLRDEAFSAAQNAGASSATAAIARAAAERSANDNGLRNFTIERKLLEEEIARIASQLDALPFNDPAADKLSLEYRGLLTRQKEVDFELARSAPEFFQLIRPKALSFDAVQALLAPGEALLKIAPSEHATFVFAITPTGTHWHRSTLTDFQVAELVEFLRFDLDPWGSEVTNWDQGYSLAEAHRLYAELIAPLEEALKGANTILYAADGALATIPLTVLLTEPPEDPETRLTDFAALSWLGDRYAFSQLPSIASLAYLRGEKRKARADGQELQGFGDPLLLGPPARRGARSGASVGKMRLTGKTGDSLADVEALRKMALLPGTGVELEALRLSVGADERATILRTEATEAAVKSADLSSARFVAFATHGLLAGQAGSGTEPGLVFTPPATASARDDGLLSASEILSLKLAADWVILSACNTAAGDGLGEEALSGLARAFFYAGARSLMASHWPVSDDAAPVLTVTAVQALLEEPGVSRAVALQRAMKAARESSDIPNAAHPSNWAAFINIGDPR